MVEKKYTGRVFIRVYRLAIDAKTLWGDDEAGGKYPSLLEDFQTGTASMDRQRHHASIARGFYCFCLTARYGFKKFKRFNGFKSVQSVKSVIKLRRNIPRTGNSPSSQRISLWLQGSLFVLPTAAILFCGFPSANGRPDR